jgi:hypothetical protein
MWALPILWIECPHSYMYCEFINHRLTWTTKQTMIKVLIPFTTSSGSVASDRSARNPTKTLQIYNFWRDAFQCTKMYMSKVYEDISINISINIFIHTFTILIHNVHCFRHSPVIRQDGRTGTGSGSSFRGHRRFVDGHDCGNPYQTHYINYII